TGLSLTAALFSGLAPALQSSRTDVGGVLKSAGPMLAGRSRLRSAFVVAQLASSIVLVVSAGLFVRALQRAGALNPGFEAQGVELATVDFTIAGYSDATAPAFARELATRVAALPSVESATIAKTLPGGFESLRFGLTVPGEAPNTGPGSGAPQARPPERSGDHGAPRAEAWGVRGGEAPDLNRHRLE